MWCVSYERDTACGWIDGGKIATFDKQSDAKEFYDRAVELHKDITFYVDEHEPLPHNISFSEWRAGS